MLVVLAHPDDESFGIGGTLALYAQRGVEVFLVTATRGDAGTVDPEFLKEHESVAALRIEHELRCAAQVLGLADVFLLDYRDSGMPGTPDNEHPEALVQAPTEEVAARIVHYIRQLRPQVVITHDPIGGYKHPDHIAVHRATRMAFYAAGDPEFMPGDLPPFQPQKLYYSTFSKRLIRLLVRVLPWLGVDARRWGRNNDIDLVDLAEEDPFPIHAEIDYRTVRETRERAAACHASQLESGPPRRGLLSRLFGLVLGAKDQFMRAHPPADSSVVEQDLFQGVEL